MNDFVAGCMVFALVGLCAIGFISSVLWLAPYGHFHRVEITIGETEKIFDSATLIMQRDSSVCIYQEMAENCYNASQWSNLTIGRQFEASND